MHPLLSYWTLDWLTLGLLAGLGLLYGIITGWRLQPGAGLYGTALVLIGIAQLSPLHFLGVHYLLSAHMAEHILLLLVAAPLLVLGLPRRPTPGAAGAMTKLAHFFGTWPWLGWLLGLGTMWLWHIPAVYDMTMAHDFSAAYGSLASIPFCQLTGSSTSGWANLAHVLHPISLLLAGVGFVWPVLGPDRRYRLHPLPGMLYLFTACAGCSLLGVLITFAPVGVYQTYTGADYYGFVHQIRQNWGFDPATDQQTAGLLMWVPGCLLYFSGIMYLFINWLSGKDEPAIRTTGTLIMEETK